MSKNPYKILGVSPSADDEEIKRAYLELVRKYHPDRYVDSDLADLANEKMKEINAAYEEIGRMRAAARGEYTGQGGTNAGQNGYGTGQSGTGTGFSGNCSSEARAAFIRIRNAINAEDFDAAERMLGEIAVADRVAEWYFLTGCVQLKRGHTVDAGRSFETACRMDPTNREYRDFLDRMHAGAKAFGGGYDTRPASGCSVCDVCFSLICADCCCECTGGDLISCC